MAIKDWRAAGMEDALEEITDAVETQGHPNIAVTSEPYGGRDVFIDHAASQFEDRRVERISLDSLMKTPDSSHLDEADVLMVDDCHYLFRRRIGGFDRLEDFMQQAADADTMVITSWNSYAWQYLQHAKHIDQMFSYHIAVPRLDTEAMTGYIRSATDYDAVDFVDDREDDPFLKHRRYPVRVPWRGPIEIPYVKPDFAAIDGDRKDVETAIIERIRKRSGGLPGVAEQVWEESIDSGTISPDSILPEFDDIDIDEMAAYALRTVLMNEEVTEEALENVVAEHAVRRVIREMKQHDLVSVDETIRLNPLALPAIMKELERRRLLW